MPLMSSEWFQELTPEMHHVIEAILTSGNPPIDTLSAVQARETYEIGSQELELPKPKIECVVEKSLFARDGAKLPARLYVNDSQADALKPVVLYLHGGGFTFGSINSHDIVCRVIAELTGVAVVSLEYRLAPEHHFPIAYNDAEDALLWLSENAAQWGLDASRLAVAGDSAGGGLAAALAVFANKEGIELKAQALIYPCISAFAQTASRQKYAQVPVLTQSMLDWFIDNFIGNTDDLDWRLSLLSDELTQADLKGLAPAIFLQAQCDVLVDEGLAYAERLRKAGVPVGVELYRGVTHEFIKMGKVLPQALQALTAASVFLKNALQAPSR